MQPLFYSQISAFRNIQESQKSSNQSHLTRELLLIAAINEQFHLTQQLIQSQYRLTEELKKEKQSSDSGQSSLANNQKTNKRVEIQEEQDFKFASDKDNDSSSPSRSSKSEEPLTRLRIKKVFKYDIETDSDEEQRKNIRKCETKNIIKNFIKSIFNFIRKHRKYVQRVLQAYNVQYNSFLAVMESFNGKVNTIVELRQLWTQKPYNQIFRIISTYFLRKYSLKHIFHSRISNHQIHLKYRQKLLKSLQKPQYFTSLKDF